MRGPGSLHYRHSPSFDTGLLNNVETWPTHNSYRIQLAHFAEFARNGATPAIPLAQSVANVHVLEGLVTSLREGKRVDIALPPEITATLSP